MTKLRTLKDIYEKEDTIRDVSYNVALDRVRAEAVKWIKEMSCRDLAIPKFMDFFNITDEDLK